MLRATMPLLCFKLSFYLFGHTKEMSVTYEKAQIISFIEMQQQTVKFIFVRINMKQVLYMLV